MKISRLRFTSLLFLSVWTLSLTSGVSAQSQTRKRPSPGFNLFSVEQDVEIGQKAAAEAEGQVSLLNDSQTNAYLSRVIARLASQAPGAKYPYSIKAVNDAAINAFALPGGPMYVNRGLIAAARSEAELAGVLAHEMSHVALRHGTHQVSKAYLSQTGLGLLGGLFGKNENTSKVLNTVGGVGLNVAFLKFGRDDEYQADMVGAEMMAGAGYNPAAMADFFQLLRAEKGRDPGKLESFLSSHPASAEREARIRAQARGLRKAGGGEVGGFQSVKARLAAMPPAPTRRGAAEPRTDETSAHVGTPVLTRGPATSDVAEPSPRFVAFGQRGGLFTLQYPDNWRTYGASSGYAVSLAPEGGVVETGSGEFAMSYGVVINRYAPFEGSAEGGKGRGWSGSLEEATDDLVRQLLLSNPHLRADERGTCGGLVDGSPSCSVELFGRSQITGLLERVSVVTRGLSSSHILYALAVAPRHSDDGMTRAFTRMLRSLTINEASAQRTASSANHE